MYHILKYDFIIFSYLFSGRIYIAFFYDNNNKSNNNDYSIFYMNQNNHSSCERGLNNIYIIIYQFFYF